MSTDYETEQSAAEPILPSELPLNGLTFENSYHTHPKSSSERVRARRDLGRYVMSIVPETEMPEVQAPRFASLMVSRILRASRPDERVDQEILQTIEGERAICHGNAELDPELTQEELAECFGGKKTGKALAIFFRNHAKAGHGADWNWLTSTD